jgi:hypothetical protein
MSEYTEQANTFLEKHGLEFRAVLVGDDCPPFCQDAEKDIDMDKINVYPRKTHIHGKHYRCTISRKGRGHVSFDYWNSYSDEEQRYARRHTWEHQSFRKYQGQKLREVSAYDLLACLTKYDPGTFENFCSDFGYSDDSRKAEQTYHAVVKEYQKVSRFFTQEELNLIKEIN